MLPNGYRVRPAIPDDVAPLPEIEQAAASLFGSYPHDLGLTDDILSHVNSIETFSKAQQAGYLWVCAAKAGDIVGFALVRGIGGHAHLDELDVLPSHGRRGVGSALLQAVCSWATAAGYPGVTLRTFRDVPWNAPFYRRRGFIVVASTALSPEHGRLETIERERGLRVDLRVTMVSASVDLRNGSAKRL